jgi:hypothetical protein
MAARTVRRLQRWHGRPSIADGVERDDLTMPQAYLSGGLAAMVHSWLVACCSASLFSLLHARQHSHRRRSYLGRLQRLLEQTEVVMPEETPRVVAEDPDDDNLP